MNASDKLGRIRNAWVGYIVVLTSLLVLVFAAVVGTWPVAWDAVVDALLLPNWRPSPWPVAPPAEALAGCYVVSFGEWVPKEDLGSDSGFVTAPQNIELTTEPNKYGTLTVRPAPGSGGTLHRFATWRVTPKGTVVLAWSTGFSGLTAELGPTAGGLRGRAKTFWDFPRGAQVASVSARRIGCRRPDAK